MPRLLQSHASTTSIFPQNQRRRLRASPLSAPLTDDNGASAQESDLFLQSDPVARGGLRLPVSSLTVPHRLDLLNGLSVRLYPLQLLCTEPRERSPGSP